MEKFMEPWVLWMVIGLGLLLVELVLPALIIFFFGVGALFVGILCLFTEWSLNAQLFIFLASSLVFLFSLRRWLSSVFEGSILGESDTPLSSEEFVGDRGVAISAIDPLQGGKVELHGSPWTAESEEAIAVGERVEVISRNSLVVRVKKLRSV